MNILEIGIGDRIHPDTTICMDIDKEILAKYAGTRRKVLHDMNKLPLPFENNSMDKVYMIDVLEHLERSPEEVLKEIFRILRPKCKLIIRVPNAYSWKNRILFLFGHLPDTFRPQHKRFFSYHHLDMLMRNAGLVTKRNKKIYIPQSILNIYKFSIDLEGEKQF